MKWVLTFIYIMANPSDISKTIKIKAEIAMPSKAICLKVKSINHNIVLECVSKRGNK